MTFDSVTKLFNCTFNNPFDSSIIYTASWRVIKSPSIQIFHNITNVILRVPVKQLNKKKERLTKLSVRNLYWTLGSVMFVRIRTSYSTVTNAHRHGSWSWHRSQVKNLFHMMIMGLKRSASWQTDIRFMTITYVNAHLWLWLLECSVRFWILPDLSHASLEAAERWWHFT